MPAIIVNSKGDFKRSFKYFKGLQDAMKLRKLDKYGEMGVEALASATPVETGLTADSWTYKVEHGDGRTTLTWYNTHVNKGVNIAIILQYGHGTGTGGYVEGIDYINPALKPIFDKIAKEVWEEVKSL